MRREVVSDWRKQPHQDRNTRCHDHSNDTKQRLARDLDQAAGSV